MTMGTLQKMKASPTGLADEAAAMVEVRGIGKIYPGGVEALRGIDLMFPQGKLTSLLGPSGCGKTTLLKIIAGLLRPDAGEVIVAGKKVTGPGPERAFVFQDFALLPWATVLRNVGFGLELRGTPKAERETAARHYIGEVGLAGFEDTLSPRALRRHAPAGRARPRAGGECRCPADGRAVLGRRRADPPQVPGGSAAASRPWSARPSSSSPTASKRLSTSPIAWCCCPAARGRCPRSSSPISTAPLRPDDIRRDRTYLDTVEEIWQGLRQYVT